MYVWIMQQRRVLGRINSALVRRPSGVALYKFMVRGTLGNPVHVGPLPNDLFTVGRSHDGIVSAMPWSGPLRGLVDIGGCRRLMRSAISGLTRCKRRLIGEIVRSQYHSCTELPQKNAPISYRSLWCGSVAADSRPANPISASGSGRIEDDQVDLCTAFALSLLATYNDRFRRRCCRHGFRSRKASGTGCQGPE